MRRREDDIDAPGQDSFLDVVANLVGILIILVMVIGIRAKEAYIHAAPESSDIEMPSESEVASATLRAGSIEQDVNETTKKIRRHELEIAYRQKERDKLLLLLTAVEEQLGAEKSKLTASQQQQIALQRELFELRNRASELRAARDAAENSTAATSVIEHLPTPMAKTVFGRELHVRLMGGRLVVLPWEELVEKLKAEAQQQLWKLQNAPSITEDAGPVGGFRIRYTLKQVDYPIQTKAGPIVQRRVELDRFELIPITDELGEPFERALQPNSELFARLSDADPRQTTVTVWVYPDSFDQFRVLKSALYKKGFLTAARPMPEGRLIGGSPHGTRSASQ